MSKRGPGSPRMWRSCETAASFISPHARGAAPSKSRTSIAMPLPDGLRHALVLARKDLLVEFRSRTALISAAVFVVLVLIVFNFGRDPTAVSTVDLAPSILWVTFTFAAILALNRA